MILSAYKDFLSFVFPGLAGYSLHENGSLELQEELILSLLYLAKPTVKVSDQTQIEYMPKLGTTYPAAMALCMASLS